MNSYDLSAFCEEFRRLSRVFPFRGSPDDVQRAQSDYFKAFTRFSLIQVAGGVDRLIESRNVTKFPLPNEWRSAMPPPPFTGRHLSLSEAQEYAFAEQSGVRFVGEPCSCQRCVDAGVTEYAVRFVPEFDDDTDLPIKVFNPIKQQVVTAGHWAHGEELAMWYLAYEKARDDWRAWAETSKNAKRERRDFLARLQEIQAAADAVRDKKPSDFEQVSS